jgi:hypothetical protein
MRGAQECQRGPEAKGGGLLEPFAQDKDGDSGILVGASTKNTLVVTEKEDTVRSILGKYQRYNKA